MYSTWPRLQIANLMALLCILSDTLNSILTNFCLCIAFHRYEFKTNHEEWVGAVKPKLGPDISAHVLAAVNTTNENIKSFYKVRTEMRAAINSLLKVIPFCTSIVYYWTTTITILYFFPASMDYW